MSHEPAIVHRPGYSRLRTEDSNHRGTYVPSDGLRAQSELVSPDGPSHQDEAERSWSESTVRAAAESRGPVVSSLPATHAITPSQLSTDVPISFPENPPAAPPNCRSSKSAKHKTLDSPIAIVVILLAGFSTAFSAIFLVIGLHGPSYGGYIGKHGYLSPSKAAFLTTLVAKLVELSFATIAVAFVGQVLARRAVEQQKETGAGITLAEMNMRTWIMQPGALATQWESTRYAGRSILGLVSITAALLTLLYTSAATALVQPQPVMQWTPRQLQALVKAQFANVNYIAQGCKSPIRSFNEPVFNATNPDLSNETCLRLNFGSGALYNLGRFLGTWRDIVIAESENGTVIPSDRPIGTTLLYGNTTIRPAWIEKAPVSQPAFPRYRVNNVTMAMPHPGVIQAAQDPINRLPLLSGSDVQLEIRASLPSPMLNVICVTMDIKQVRPFVYSTWAGRNKMACNETDWTSRGLKGFWPYCASYPDNLDLYLNGTEFDDIFQWGARYGDHKYPPIFPTLPWNYNTIVNNTLGMIADSAPTSIYILAKGGSRDSLGLRVNDTEYSNYAICGISAGITPFCSTRYNITTGGASLQVVCDDEDPHQYVKSEPDAAKHNPIRSIDFVDIASAWVKSVPLGSGLSNANETVDRQLTQLIVTSGNLSTGLPSTAEALAVLGADVLVRSSLDAPTVMFWNYTDQEIAGSYQYFNASVRMQEYKSGSTQAYEKGFVVVLMILFAMSALILTYFLFHRYWYTDFSEPTHLFTLALQSPSSDKIAGSCATGPIGDQYNIRWQVGTDDGHYYVTPQDESAADHGSDMKKRHGWKEDVELLLRK